MTTMVYDEFGGIYWVGGGQRPNRKMPERPVHWTWLHGPTAPTAEQLEHGRVAAWPKEGTP